MAEIHADQDVVQVVARQLLALTDDPNEITSTHGDGGRIFLVSDELGERWYQKYIEDEVPVAPKKKGK
jgi:hypothetical protein